MPKGKRIEPLDLDEIENNPSLNGMLAFRETPHFPALLKKGQTRESLQTGTVPFATTVPTLEVTENKEAIAIHIQAEKPQQKGGQLQTGTVPDNTTVPSSITVPTIEVTENKEAIAIHIQTEKPQQKGGQLQTGTVPDNTTVPSSITVPVPKWPRTRIFRATRVEHGHTPGERLILQALWTKATGTDKERTIRIGYDRLAMIASVNWKTARSCLRSLEEKLAIETLEPENSNSREGRLYRVYGFDLILERRKQNGLEWVQKGRGVEFIQTGTVPSTTTVPNRGTVPEDGAGTVPVSGGETVPDIGAPLRSSKERRKNTTTVQLTEAMRMQGLELDNDAIARIYRDCQALVPDIQPGEIVDLLVPSLRNYARNRRVENPVGLLLSNVSLWFKPGLVLALRERESQREAEAFEDSSPTEHKIDPHEEIRRMFSGEGNS